MILIKCSHILEKSNWCALAKQRRGETNKKSFGHYFRCMNTGVHFLCWTFFLTPDPECVNVVHIKAICKAMKCRIWFTYAILHSFMCKCYDRHVLFLWRIMRCFIQLKTQAHQTHYEHNPEIPSCGQFEMISRKLKKSITKYHFQEEKRQISRIKTVRKREFYHWFFLPERFFPAISVNVCSIGIDFQKTKWPKQSKLLTFNRAQYLRTAIEQCGNVSFCF